MSYVELRNTNDSHGKVQNSVESGKNKLGVIERVKYLTSLKKKKGKSDNQYESDRSPIFDSDNECTTTTNSFSSIYNAESNNSNFSERFTTSSGAEDRLDGVQRSWSVSTWNGSYRGKTMTGKQKPLTLTKNRSAPLRVC